MIYKSMDTTISKNHNDALAVSVSPRRLVSHIKQARGNFRTKTENVFVSRPGLGEDVIRELSRQKHEPRWMREFRLHAYQIWLKKEMPRWGADLSHIPFDNLHYYVRPQEKMQRSWDEVPQEIKETFEKLGIPQAERAYLAGAGAQFESEVVYHSIEKKLKKQGVIFASMDEAVRKYPKMVRSYFGTIIPPTDNKFAALNSAVWSGGSFIYVPKGVHVELPLQAYFRINRRNMGQFERTLIIADEGSSVHYIEGCTAPTYSSDSLHAAVVEIVARDRARVQYTTIQNWSSNVYNLVTKRAVAYRESQVLWLDCNIGSKVTMKYPCVILRGEGARGEVQSLAFAAGGQHQDTGAKMIHVASNTSSRIISRSLSKGSGRASYRGLVKVAKGARNTKVSVTCDALLLDSAARSDTYPTMDIAEQDATISHEASVGSIGEDELFYLQSRGIAKRDALGLVVNGFARPIARNLPLEYAVELQRLLSCEMEESIG